MFPSTTGARRAAPRRACKRARQSGRSLRENRCSFAPLSRTRSTTPPAASRSILYALRASRCAREGLGFFGAIAERYTSIGPREIVARFYFVKVTTARPLPWVGFPK